MAELFVCVLVLAAVALFFISRPSHPPSNAIDTSEAWRRRQNRRAGR